LVPIANPKIKELEAIHLVPIANPNTAKFMCETKNTKHRYQTPWFITTKSKSKQLRGN